MCTNFFSITINCIIPGIITVYNCFLCFNLSLYPKYIMYWRSCYNNIITLISIVLPLLHNWEFNNIITVLAFYTITFSILSCQTSVACTSWSLNLLCFLLVNFDNIIIKMATDRITCITTIVIIKIKIHKEFFFF